MKLTAALLITMVLCSSLGAGSAHDVVPSFLLTLLEGSAEQVYAGLISQYNVDDVTGAALGALKECIDELSPAHVKALVDLLVTHSFYYDRNCLEPCSLVPASGPRAPKYFNLSTPWPQLWLHTSTKLLNALRDGYTIAGLYNRFLAG
ncbi:secretoglobin family 1C member 1 isoform X1 [Strix uralensis]|uniref:secretoglobin family 1C member 1 isoform X1 n=1 Tax=Strix uralensis TaxID=36305 RepID=UPI003DA3305B